MKVIVFTIFISEFNQKFNSLLEERRLREEKVAEETKVQAAADMQQWNAQHETKLSAKREKNRSEEETFKSSQETDTEGSLVWDRVTKLVDLNTDSVESKTADKGRMKKLLIQLKNEPLKA